jgi:beta-glucosidase
MPRHRSAHARTGLALSACLALALPQAHAASPAPDAARGIADPAAWPAMTSPIPRDDALEQRVADLLASMTLEEKVGQVVQGDLGSLTPDDVRRYRLGSVLAGGNSDPGGRYDAPARDWLALADALHAASVDTRDGGTAIPVLLGIDAVHGHNNVVGATLFPHNIGLGAANDPDLVRRIARATAAELRATGFEWTFAPTVTVPRDDRWGRTYEGYSEDPTLVSRYATAVVEGLQGEVGTPGFLDATRVLASSKHYIGDGGTTGGKDKGNTEVSEAELRDVHGAGHVAALAAGTQTVMASFSSWNGVRMHGNRSLLTDVLKERLGFDGFVVGDWNGHADVDGCTKHGCAAALNAGLDMYMAPDTWREVYDDTLAAVRAGAIPMQRLDDAVTRVLRVKARLGLLDAGAPSRRELGGQLDLLGSAEHRALARDAVRRSLVLLKNNRGLLPLDPGANVLVAGDGADDIGKQAGGWTLSWQGTGTRREDYPNAESIWAGIEAATRAAGGRAVLSVDGTWTQRPDVAIVVFGEEPYAEYMGDVPSLAYQPGKERDLALLRRLKEQDIPVVAVFLSGRPLWVNREINASDAFVAAWLPGSEGGGVADMLFRTADGAIAHDFTGRLPFSWPRTAVQTPLNAGQPDYDPQFALGHGLSYATPRESPQLPEESGLAHGGADPGVFFARGAPGPDWTLTLAEAGGAPQAVDALPARSAKGHVSVAAVDHQAQEDARRITWAGTGEGTVALQAAAPADLSRESMAEGALVATVRVDQAPTQPVTLAAGCGEGCSGSVAIDPLLRALPTGTWQDIAVPLACLARAGADMGAVSDMFRLSSAGAFALSVSQVVLGPASGHAMECKEP